MPRYYCDYCDAYLTHDSASVRKQHNSGFKHKSNFKAYYLQYEEEAQMRLYAEAHGLPMPRPPHIPVGGPRPPQHMPGGGPPPLHGGGPPPGRGPPPPHGSHQQYHQSRAPQGPPGALPSHGYHAGGRDYR